MMLNTSGTKRTTEMAASSSTTDSSGVTPSTIVTPVVPTKKVRTIDPATSFTCSNSEELDLNVLKFQNKMLAQRLIVRQKLEEDLRQKLEKAESKHTSSEATVYVINRYWNQLNEDVRIMLQRFDSEISDENEQTTEEETTTAFLTQLSSWDPEEMSEQLQQRVDASTRAIMKVVQAFDRIVQRNSKISSALNGEESLESAVKATNIELTNENKNLHILTTALHKQLRELQLQYNESTAENERLEKKNEELQDNCWDFEVKLNRLRHREEQLEKNLEKANERIIVLENQLETGGTSEGSPKDGVASTSTSVKKTTKGNFGRMDSTGKMDELQEKLEDQEKLAGTRLDELTELNTKYKEALMEIEKLKMQLQCLPSEVVTETAEYKCLQSHFSVLYNETMQLKAQLEETKNQLQTSKNNHLRQIEHMESEELSMQRRLRTEVIQLEDNLAQVRREHEMLKLEYEQMVAANEQTAPINREMRNLITSLQSHNSQLKTEVNRQKKKFKDCCHEINKLRQELSHYSHVKQSSSSTPSVTASNVPLMTSNVETQPSLVSSDAPQSFSASVSPVKSESATKIETQAIKTEPTESTVVTTPAESGSDTQSSMDAVSVTSVKKEVPEDVAVSASAASNLDDRKAYNDLKAQMSQLSRKHETLKSMYETSQKQVSSLKKQLSAKNQTEATNLSTDIKPTTSGGSAVVPSKTDKPLTLEEYAALNNKLKEKLRGLEKALQQQKLAQQQHEDALLSEMEVTGNAYENMQETNVRLVQQLREKDAANFKLMSDMIKSQQIQKLLKEEKECLTDQVVALNAQVEAQNQVVRKLEEKERLIQQNLLTMEKEAGAKQQAMELHKRKAIEAAQSAADLKLHLDKYLSQLKEAQSTVAEKTSALQEQSYRTTRAQEKINKLERECDRAKKFELAATADEVLMEEIREYKSQLICSACKSRNKDAVLTRCFHVFCYECVKIRYESRDRKCPKCNMTFGAKDFHRLYLA